MFGGKLSSIVVRYSCIQTCSNFYERKPEFELVGHADYVESFQVVRALMKLLIFEEHSNPYSNAKTIDRFLISSDPHSITKSIIQFAEQLQLPLH